MSAAYVRVNTRHLKASPANIRRDLGDLTELAASIEALGILQPLVITEPVNGKSTVIDGHRRLEAARIACLEAVPCLISETAGQQAILTTMLAAAMHEQLKPLDQARAFAALRDQGLTVAEISGRTGYSTATVNGRLLLTELPDDAQKLVKRGELTLGQAVDLGRQLKASREGKVYAERARTPHFTSAHRLHRAAAALCTPQHQQARSTLSNVCGPCWEAAIRDDERSEQDPPPVRDVVDEVAVQRAIDGDRAVRLNVSEREEAVERLARQGLSDRNIAMRLNITDRTVLRCRQRRGVESRWTA